MLSQHLMQAGLTLIVEANQYAKSPFQQVKVIRNGLIIALLAAAPIRVKNYTALDVGTSFKEVDGTWWIVVPRRLTKTNGGEERPVPGYLNTAIDLYLKQSRPILIGKQAPATALWISSRTGQRFTTKNLGTLISKITRLRGRFLAILMKTPAMSPVHWPIPRLSNNHAGSAKRSRCGLRT